MLAEDDTQTLEALERALGAPTRVRRDVRTWLLDGVLVSLASVVVTAIAFRVFSIPLRVPFMLSKDGYWNLAFTKTIRQTGGWMTDPRLGAPFGYQGWDFPTGADNLNFVALKAFTSVFADPVLALNMFILSCFTLTSVAGWLGARLVGLSRVTSIVLGLVYGFAPFHFQRAAFSVFLANYIAVPFGCVLAFWLLSDRPPFYEDRSRSKLLPALHGPRTWFAVVAVLIIASTGIYYAGFTLLLLAVALLLSALSREWRSVRSGLVLAVGIAGIVAVQVAPSILYMLRHGHNPMVASRHLFELDEFGLRLVQLVSPVPGHWLPPLSRLAAQLRGSAGPAAETGSWLGLLGVVGLAIAVGTVLRRAVQEHRGSSDLAAKAGVFALVCMVVGSVSGFSWLIGLVTASELRAWSRISIVISFLALVALGSTVDRAIGRWMPSHASPVWRVAFSSFAAIIVVVFAVSDQASRTIVPDSSANANQWAVTDRFVRGIEARLDPGAMVFQLPVIPHPEAGPLVRLDSYELFDGFIHSTKLRWTFGAFQGRESDWQFIVKERPVPDLLDGIAAAGFTGLYLDRYGYQSDDLEGRLVDAGLTPTLVSEDQRRVFYDLRPYAHAARARLGDAVWAQLGTDTLYPVTWWNMKGINVQTAATSALDVVWSIGSSARLDLWNRGPRSTVPAGRPVLLHVQIRSPGGPAELRITQGGQSISVAVDETWRAVEVPLTLHSARSPVHIDTVTPPPGRGHLEMRALAVPER